MPKKRKKKSQYTKNLERRRNNPRSNIWKKKMLKEWGRCIHMAGKCAIDNGECKGKLEAHHIVSKSVGCLAGKLQNGILLCSYHHKYSPRLSPHKGLVGFAAWMSDNRSEQWIWCRSHRWDIEKPDYKAEYEFLKEIKEIREL